MEGENALNIADDVTAGTMIAEMTMIDSDATIDVTTVATIDATSGIVAKFAGATEITIGAMSVAPGLMTETGTGTGAAPDTMRTAMVRGESLGMMTMMPTGEKPVGMMPILIETSLVLTKLTTARLSFLQKTRTEMMRANPLGATRTARSGSRAMQMTMAKNGVGGVSISTSVLSLGAMRRRMTRATRATKRTAERPLSGCRRPHRHLHGLRRLRPISAMSLPMPRRGNRCRPAHPTEARLHGCQVVPKCWPALRLARASRACVGP